MADETDANAFDEFAFIEEIFAPLSAGAEGADDLRDDAAVIASKGDLVVTKDLLVAGVHFPKAEKPEYVARKALRVNISDLVAKGVKPKGYFFGCVWPADTGRETVELFAQGLAEDQAAYGVTLYGGDTTRHVDPAAPLTISITMFGVAPARGAVRRSGAQVGDWLFVTGAIGDAGLGLSVARGAMRKAPPEIRAAFLDAYRLPDPPAAFATTIARYATGALDVSDGLIADAAHLAKASGLRAVIRAEDIPISPEAARFIKAAPGSRDAIIAKLATSGDDYQVLFAAPKDAEGALIEAGRAAGVRVAMIGVCKKGKGVSLLDANDEDIIVETPGFSH